MRLLVFGSRNLTARHLPAMRRFIAAEGCYVHNGQFGPVASELILSCRDSHDLMSYNQIQFHDALTLLHGDGPPGKTPGAVGADKLAEVAASLEWPDTRRCRRFPPEHGEGESWGQAAARRNAAMVALRPDRALCFHTDLDRSRGSAMTADFLKRAGLGYRYIKLSSAGEVLTVEER